MHVDIVLEYETEILFEFSMVFFFINRYICNLFSKAQCICMSLLYLIFVPTGLICRSC